jgi:hypothetical protein
VPYDVGPTNLAVGRFKHRLLFPEFPLTDTWTLQFAGPTQAIGEFLPVMAESIEILTIPPHESWSRRRWKPAK